MAAPWSLDGGGAGLSPWCRERRTTTAASDPGLLTAEDLLCPRFPGRQIRELPYIFLISSRFASRFAYCCCFRFGRALVEKTPRKKSKLLILGSLSFKRAQLNDNYPSSLQVETEISINTADIAAPAPDSSPATVVPLVQRALARVMYTDGGLGRGEPKARGGGAEAAEGVQELPAAAAAVLAEQSWWKLLDFALLKRSSCYQGIKNRLLDLNLFSPKQIVKFGCVFIQFEKGLSKDGSKR
ncbi:hypothetical protein ACQ4PT_065120 [Festuca glaucescens]